MESPAKPAFRWYAADHDLELAWFRFFRGDMEGSLEALEQNAVGEEFAVRRMLLSALAHCKRKAFQEALELSHQALNSDPENVMCHLLCCAMHYLTGNVSEGLRICDAMLETFPDNYLVHAAHGFLLASQHKFHEAITAYTNAIRINPQLESLHFRLAAQYAQIDDLDRCAAQIKEAIGLLPSISRRISLSALYEQEQDFEAALQELHDAFGIMQTPYLSYAIARLQAKTGKIDDSIQAYEQVLQVQNRRWQGWSELGFLYLQKRRPEDALRAFSTALKIMPYHHTSLIGLARSHVEMDQTDEALGCVRQCLRILPDDADALALLAGLCG